MKKTYVNFASILVAALCLAFTACNGMTNSGETGTVQVFIGGGAARAVGGNGLPMFDGTNTTITVTDEDGELLAQGATSVVLNVAIGTKITVKAVVTTATGEWRDSETHTVKPGVNNIDLKLSKTPKVAANLLFSMKKDASGSVLLSLNTADGTSLLDGISDNPKPVTARDKIGRVYVLYKDSIRHIKRFDVDGNEDRAFRTNFTSALTAASISISTIDNIAIDRDEGYIFLFKDNTVYCFKEEITSSPSGVISTYFKSFGSDTFPSGTPILNVTAAAVDGGIMFITDESVLYACKFGFQALPVPGNKTLEFNTTTSASANLDKLRKNGAFGNNNTECTGLFADDDDVYCLLREQQLSDGQKYALGQLVRYKYSGSGSSYALTNKNTIGLHSEAAGSDSSLAFEAGAFSNPIGFIGYDEENIYIADDGVNIGYINENWRIKGNKNRIAAFNRETKTLTFSDTGATWYDEKPKYPSGTKTLLWGKDENQEFRYWIGEDGTETFLEGNKLFASASAEKPTDVFCYDQDGNLYIVWKDGSSRYRVRRFELKEDGSYNTQGTDTSSLTFFEISAIAVDISDGQNILYYAYKDTRPSASGSNGHIKKYNWVLGTLFNTGLVDNSYDVTFNANTEPVTALAANKDGLFAGVKESYQDVGTVWQYRLKIKKYKKSNGVADGELILVNQAPVDTDLSGKPIDNTFTDHIRIQYGESINALQVFDGVLYALSSKSRKTQKQNGIPYYTDAFKSSGKLYKIGNTNDTLSGNAVVLAKKDWNDANKIGYGFYRFIAVKYDEAERIKFIIASDGAWDENGIAAGQQIPKPPAHNYDKVLEYDLAGSLQAEREAGGSFSKTLMIGSGFDWN